jgi:hypothetical protein
MYSGRTTFSPHLISKNDIIEVLQVSFDGLGEVFLKVNKYCIVFISFAFYMLCNVSNGRLVQRWLRRYVVVPCYNVLCPRQYTLPLVTTVSYCSVFILLHFFFTEFCFSVTNLSPFVAECSCLKTTFPLNFFFAF